MRKRKVKLSTRLGDCGETGILFSPERISKSDERIQACGILDEAVCVLGVAKSFLNQLSCSGGQLKRIKIFLEEVQEDLYTLCSQTVTPQGRCRDLKKTIDRKRLEWLEARYRHFASLWKPGKKTFVMPGANSVSAFLDLGRAHVRRSESTVARLHRKKIFFSKDALTYLNRLSDVLYILARLAEKNRPCF